ncbi:MAG TPA: YraN family protein [Gemmatimonadales bacterium]|nr:YraN family protein [Gemmatimonadales bacterium]
MRRNTFIPIRQWRDQRHVRGVRGEQLALAWLTARGWNVESHRFRAGRHDLDLVIRRGRLVAFVEVKTRATSSRGDPLHAIGWRKVRSLAWAAECWRARYGRPGDQYRFDILTVGLGRGPGKGPIIGHLEDAIRP